MISVHRQLAASCVWRRRTSKSSTCTTGYVWFDISRSVRKCTLCGLVSSQCQKKHLVRSYCVRKCTLCGLVRSQWIRKCTRCGLIRLIVSEIRFRVWSGLSVSRSPHFLSECPMDLVRSLSNVCLCDGCHPVPVPMSWQQCPILGRWCLSSHRAWPGRGTLDMPWRSTQKTTTFRSRTWSRSSMDPTRYVLVTVIRLVSSCVPCLCCCALPLVGAATGIFVATNILSRQTRICCERTCLVMTKACLSWQNFCHDKHFCHEKTCCNKYLSQQI